LGTAGRWFESSCPDHYNQILSEIDFPEKIGRGKAGGRKSSSAFVHRSGSVRPVE
jgi:hypothetical protein